jgi:hypothetical protein
MMVGGGGGIFELLPLQFDFVLTRELICDQPNTQVYKQCKVVVCIKRRG